MTTDFAHLLVGKKPERTLPVAALLITAAGMLDAFTYTGYGGVFANAMTGNIVLLVVRLAKGEAAGSLPFAAPIIAYLCGVAVAHTLKEKPLRNLVPSPARMSLGLEIVFLIVVAFLPKIVPDMLVVTGIAFVAALQATAFTRLGEFAYTSVTTSANLRHFAGATMAWLVFGKGREKAVGITVFSVPVCLLYWRCADRCHGDPGFRPRGGMAASYIAECGPGALPALDTRYTRDVLRG